MKFALYCFKRKKNQEPEPEPEPENTDIQVLRDVRSKWLQSGF
jgi:hypothetical protein